MFEPNSFHRFFRRCRKSHSSIDLRMLRCFRTLLDQCNSWPQLKRIHTLLTTAGLSHTEPFAWKILAFAATFDIDYAYHFFRHLPSPKVFHYNAIIRGFSNSKNPIKAIRTFKLMLLYDVVPDHLTYPFLAKASARLSKSQLGACVHGRVLKVGLVADVFIANSLIHMYGACGEIASGRNVFDKMPMRNLVSWNSILDGYGKCGDVTTMRHVFDEMPERDVVSWSALVDGYVKEGNYAEALTVFGRMKAEGPMANEVTMVSVLCACAHLCALEQGRAMHRYVVDHGLPLTLVLRTSLVDMYAKCGAIEDARRVFCQVSKDKTDVLIWNAMIGGLASHGYTSEALEVYKEMRGSGIWPDEITYLCLLCACAHGGLVKEAWRYFNSIAKDGMAPKSEHYACMVDVLARAGLVEEAYQFVSQMPAEPTASTLGALLNGCISHRKLDLAEMVGRRLVELDPGHDGRYIGLSNVYAVTKRWDKARTTRAAMESRGVRKIPGCSYVEVLGSLRRFIAHDLGHPESEDIYLMLDVMVEEMKLRTHPYEEETFWIST
ncbi:pentatricopeptide repeat-containing protein At5g08305 [Andrographis paniculata]|uniref:pentatricopeptide repeat-containing protein At5g08305 n=1 Tax=Andrographis paniculata TaxID=175694 RepID=UPI0021E99A8C|nr:pentatricopeptide repeat-containing protein At5g08305 [Andrographis paniculata]XP_051125306.1 pentatricopeptide repeat-containing protein At5g08305 [Andrographis paniculata]